MTELKTKPNDASVEDFISSVTDVERQSDCRVVCKLMQDATGEPPKMWGDAIVGFGSRHLKYATGRELDWPKIAFSPRKQNLTIYIMEGFEKHGELLKKLGKHTTGVSCLYIKYLSDIDLVVLTQLITISVSAHSE